MALIPYFRQIIWWLLWLNKTAVSLQHLFFFLPAWEGTVLHCSLLQLSGLKAFFLKCSSVIILAHLSLNDEKTLCWKREKGSPPFSCSKSDQPLLDFLPHHHQDLKTPWEQLWVSNIRWIWLAGRGCLCFRWDPARLWAHSPRPLPGRLSHQVLWAKNSIISHYRITQNCKWLESEETFGSIWSHPAPAEPPRSVPRAMFWTSPWRKPHSLYGYLSQRSLLLVTVTASCLPHARWKSGPSACPEKLVAASTWAPHNGPLYSAHKADGEFLLPSAPSLHCRICQHFGKSILTWVALPCIRLFLQNIFSDSTHWSFFPQLLYAYLHTSCCNILVLRKEKIKQDVFDFNLNLSYTR